MSRTSPPKPLTVSGSTSHHPPKNYLRGVNPELDRILDALGSVVTRAELAIANNPALLLDWLSAREFRHALPRPGRNWYAAMGAASSVWGKAVERLATAYAKQHPILRDTVDFQRTVLFPDGKHGFFDFLIRVPGAEKMVPVDVTTRRALKDHSDRQYGPVLHQFCYIAPENIQQLIGELGGVDSKARPLRRPQTGPDAIQMGVRKTLATFIHTLDDLVESSRTTKPDEFSSYELAYGKLVVLADVLNDVAFQSELKSNRPLAHTVHQAILTLAPADRAALVLRADYGVALTNPRWNTAAKEAEQLVQTIDIVMKQHLMETHSRSVSQLPVWRTIREQLRDETDSSQRANLLLAISKYLPRSAGLAYCMAQDMPDIFLDLLAQQPSTNESDRWRFNGMLPLSSAIAYEKLSATVHQISNSPKARVAALAADPHNRDIAVFFARYPFMETLIDLDIGRHTSRTPNRLAVPPAPAGPNPLTLADVGCATSVSSSPTLIGVGL